MEKRMRDHLRTAIVACLAGLLAAPPLSRADEPPKIQEPAPQTPKVPEQPEKPAENPAPPATVLNKNNVQGILGKQVLTTKNEDMGRIVDVIVDRTGEPRAAIVDFGGFLGVGSRKIAVDWTALEFAPEGKSAAVTLELTKDQLKAAPEYKEGKPIVVIGAAGGTQPMPSEDMPIMK
jgi:hypothetical protein